MGRFQLNYRPIMNYRGILKEHANALNAAFHVADWFVIALSAWLAHLWYLGSPELPFRYSLVILIALLSAAWLFPRFSLYQTWRGVSIIDEAWSVSLAWGSVLLTLTAVAFLAKEGSSYSRGWMLIWASAAWIGLILTRILLRFGLQGLRRKGFNQRHIIIVGSAGLGGELVRRLRMASWMGFNVVAYFHGDSDDSSRDIADVPHVGDLDMVARYVTEMKIDQVWIVMPLRDEDKVRWLLHELRNSTVDIRFVPDMFGLRLINHSIMDLAGMPVMNLSVTPMSGVNMFLKALEDRILAFLILLSISPLMFVIAIGVRSTSPGPVFYRQERVGWNGEKFMMLKFRSMPVDIERDGILWGGVGMSKKPTPFGAFLRRSSLDELPQFINVLKGDMSIVGPRPERPIFVEKFKEEIPNYMKKHMVKAGITGWAQINGWRGDTDISTRVEYDLYYIEHWSLWFDLKIIFLTVFKGFINKNAY